MLSPLRICLSIILPCLIARRGYRKGSLNFSGALVGIIVASILTVANFCFFSCLFIFFVSGSVATRIGSKRKKSIEHDFKEGGQRDWLQVLSNSGPATLTSILYLLETGPAEELPVDFSRRPMPSLLIVSTMVSLASACGDTLASELGTVYGPQEPRLITTWTRVPAGTNGGVSLVGTLSSILGGLLVGTGHYVTLILLGSSTALEASPPQWPIIIVGGAAGLLGSMIDSLLGATVQYSGLDVSTGQVVHQPGKGIRRISGCNCLDNHNVNLVTTLIMAWLTPSLAFRAWPYFK